MMLLQRTPEAWSFIGSPPLLARPSYGGQPGPLVGKPTRHQRHRAAAAIYWAIGAHPIIYLVRRRAVVVRKYAPTTDQAKRPLAFFL
jgi:hypothetical protein